MKKRFLYIVLLVSVLFSTGFTTQATSEKEEFCQLTINGSKSEIRLCGLLVEQVLVVTPVEITAYFFDEALPDLEMRGKIDFSLGTQYPIFLFSSMKKETPAGFSEYKIFPLREYDSNLGGGLVVWRGNYYSLYKEILQEENNYPSFNKRFSVIIEKGRYEGVGYVEPHYSSVWTINLADGSTSGPEYVLEGKTFYLLTEVKSETETFHYCRVKDREYRKNPTSTLQQEWEEKCGDMSFGDKYVAEKIEEGLWNLWGFKICPQGAQRYFPSTVGGYDLSLLSEGIVDPPRYRWEEEISVEPYACLGIGLEEWSLEKHLFFEIPK